jgi:hypothetical protein
MSHTSEERVPEKGGCLETGWTHPPALGNISRARHLMSTTHPFGCTCATSSGAHKSYWTVGRTANMMCACVGGRPMPKVVGGR